MTDNLADGAARAADAARSIHDSRAFRIAARCGFAVNGLLHVLIGLLALSVATGAGTGGEDADPSGALSAIAETPGGDALIWVLAAGLASLGLWLLLEALLQDVPRRRWKDAALNILKGITYGALAVPAVTIALGDRVDSDGDVQEVSAFLVQTPIGIVALGASGVVVLGIGAYFAVKGLRRRFLDDIDAPDGAAEKTVTVLGVVGYIAKGIALGALGVLLVVAAVTVDPAEAGGLDDALRSVAQLPFGAVLLGVVGIGLIAYGVYCVARARWARLR